ncbi:MAG: signal peptidase II [Acidimicrobiia bacterium]|nr:signal peptidase II [Acidimicrobiia bacterium]
MTAGARRGATLATVAAVVIAADQATKHWAVNALDRGRVIDVLWTLRFKLHFNSGLAFSLGSGRGGLIALVGLVVLAVLVRSVLAWPGRLAPIAAGVVVGGALGNIVDRAFRAGSGALGGSVIDFIDVQWWPVFNVADMAVTIGALLLIVSSFLQPEPDAATQAPTVAIAGREE